MLVGKARCCTLPTNIRLGCKGLPGTNTLAYYKNPYIPTVESFTGLAPVHVGDLLIRSLADDVGTLDEGVHAADADDAHDDQADASDEQAGVLDCVGHCQNASPDVAFQKVDYCITVSENENATIINIGTLDAATPLIRSQ
jgi:hypothetical protein